MKQILLFISLLMVSFAVDAQEEVTIDGLKYILSTESHLAKIENSNSWTGELDIPEKVTYNNEDYTVIAIDWLAFDFCYTLTKVRIPKTVLLITHYAGRDACKNPFRGCSNLVSIEVDEDNPAMCSVDGVLFSKDKTQLYCYPAGKKQKRYEIPIIPAFVHLRNGTTEQSGRFHLPPAGQSYHLLSYFHSLRWNGRNGKGRNQQ